MKKLIWILCFMISSFFFLNFVKFTSFAATSDEEVAKTQVVMTNNKNSKIQEYLGYKILSSNVDFEKSGTYEIYYQNLSSLKTIKKQIFVINEKQLSNNSFTINQELFYYNVGEEVKLIKKVKDNHYILITKSYDPEVSQDEPTSNLNMYSIINDEITWETTIIDHSYTDVCDVAIEDNKIIILGTKVFMYSGQDLFLGKYDLDGNMERMVFYSGTNYDIGKKIIPMDSGYLLIGETKSTNGEFTGTRKDTDVFILKIDKNTFKKINCYDYGLDKNDFMVDATKVEEKIFLIQQYYGENNTPTTKLLIIDEDGKITKDLYINAGYTKHVEKLIVSNNNIYIETMENNQCTIYHLNQELKLEKKYGQTHADTYRLIDVSINNNLLTILYNNFKSSGIWYEIYDLLSNKVISFTKVVIEQAEEIEINSNFEIVLYFDSDVRIKKLDILTINNLGTQIVVDKDTDIYDYDIYLNGESLKVGNKSKIEYDTSIFGEYPCQFYYEGKTLDFIHNKSLNVLSNSPVKDNQTYDNYLTLKYNGFGKLDGKEITTPYVIQEEGVHVLEIRGKNNVLETYTFTIKKISSRIDIPHQSDDVLDKNLQGDIQKQESTSSIAELNFEKNSEESKSVPILWPLAIPFSILTLCIFFFFKGVRR